MRFLTHFLAGVALGVAFAPNPPSFLAALAGAACPDKLDTLFSFGNRERWSKMHRTWSHNISYWIVPIIIWLWMWPFYLGPPLAAVEQALAFFLLGVFSHIFLDFLNPMGIGVCPFLSARSRIGLGLIKTGSRNDLALGFILVACAIFWRWKHGFSPDYFFKSVFYMGKMGRKGLWRI